MSNSKHPLKSGAKSFHIRHGFAIKDKKSDDYKIYMAWLGMRRRCLDKANKLYGGRGVKFCKRWDVFDNFLDDMGASFYEHRKKNIATSLDRINVDGNYSPKNCRWATNREQIINRRYNRLITYKGKTKRVYDWWKILCKDISYDLFRKRLYDKKWSFERAFSQRIGDKFFSPTRKIYSIAKS